MDIKELNEELEQILIELYRKDTDPEYNFGEKSYEEIVDQLFKWCSQKYYGGRTPELIEFEYDGEPRKLALVVGKAKLKNIGLKHIIDKHGIPSDYKPKMSYKFKDSKDVTEDLKQAVKNLPNALKANDVYYYNEDPTKLLFVYLEYTYIIGLSTNEEELNFLITTFKPDSPSYLQELLDNNRITKTNPFKKNNTLK